MYCHCFSWLSLGSALWFEFNSFLHYSYTCNPKARPSYVATHREFIFSLTLSLISYILLAKMYPILHPFNSVIHFPDIFVMLYFFSSATQLWKPARPQCATMHSSVMQFKFYGNRRILECSKLRKYFSKQKIVYWIKGKDKWQRKICDLSSIQKKLYLPTQPPKHLKRSIQLAEGRWPYVFIFPR